MFFLSLMVLLYHVKSEVVPILLNSSITGSLNQIGSSVYSINLGSNLTKEDLLIRVEGLNDDDNFYDPDLYVSLQNSDVSKSNFDYESTNIGDDAILIPNAEIKNKNEVYVAVQCNARCKFKLSNQIQNETELLINTETKMKSTGVNLFFFKIPKTDDERITISVETDNFSAAKVSVIKNSKDGQSNPITTYPNAFGGFSFVVIKKEYNTDDVYKMQVDLKNLLEFKVKVKSSGNIVELTGTNPDYATIENQNRICYSFKVKENQKTSDIIVTTTIFAGKAKLRINPDELPSDSSLFKLTYDMDETETLKFENSKIFGNREKSGNIYFCVYSEISTSYFINVFFEQDTELVLQNNNLISGVPQSGYISAKKINAYRLNYYGFEKNPLVSMTVYGGKPVLKLFICLGLKCIFTPSEYRNNKYTMIDSIQFSDKQINQLSNKKNLCLIHSVMKFRDCSIYAVIDCQGETECKYSISYSHGLSQTVIYENNPVFHVVEKDKTDYYRAFLHNKNDISYVSIIVTPMNGAVTLKTSLSSDPKSENGYKRMRTRDMNSDIIKYTNSELKNSSFVNIAVVGLDTSYYTVQYVVKYSKDIFSPFFLELGPLTTDYYDPNDNIYKVYSFSVDFNEKKNSNGIIISITPQEYQYSLYLYKDRTSIKYNYKTKKMENFLKKEKHSHQIFLERSEVGVEEATNYYVVVKLNENSLKPEDPIETGKYSIGVAFEGEHFILSDQIPHHLKLVSTSYQKYKYYHTNKTIGAYIMLDVFHGECKISAELNEKDNSTSQHFSVKKTNKIQSITIPPKSMKNCKKGKGCEIHIKVERDDTADSNCEYVISADSDGSTTKLINGVTSTREILPGQVHTYNIEISKKDVGVLSVRINEGSVKVDADLISDKNLMKFNLDQSHFGYQVQFDELLLKECNPKCQLVVVVNGTDLTEGNVENIYSIIFTSKATSIKLDTPYKARLIGGSWNYYKFHFSHNFSNLFVSLLTDSQGDADIYMNYGQAFPTKENATWKTASLFSSFLEINDKSQFFLDKKINMKGSYTVGIYAYKNTTYTLFVSTSSNKIHLMTNELSSSCAISKRDGECYFKYETGFKFRNELSLTPDYLVIKADFMYGTGIIYVKSFNSSKNIFEQLPNENDFTLSSKNMNTRNIIRMNLNTTYIQDHHLSGIDLLVTVQCHYPCLFNLHGIVEKKTRGSYLENGKDYIFSFDEKNPYMSFYKVEKLRELEIESQLLIGNQVTAYEALPLNEKSYDSLINYVLTKNKNLKESTISLGDRCKLNDTCTLMNYFAGTSFSIVQFKINEEEEIGAFKTTEPNTFKMSDEVKIKTGYFQVLDNYQSMQISLYPLKNNRNLRALRLYAKFKLVPRKDFETNVFREQPGENNFDYRGETDVIGQKLNMQISVSTRSASVNKENDGSFIPMYVISVFAEFHKPQTEKMKVVLNIHPEVLHVSTYKLKKDHEIFSKIKVNESNLNIYDIEPEINDHNSLEIQVSECVGHVKVILSDKVAYSNEIPEIAPYNNMRYDYGKYRTVITNPKKNYYLTIQGISGIPEDYCLFNTTENPCFKVPVAEYTVKYTSRKINEDVSYQIESNSELTYEIINGNYIIIKWGKAIKTTTNSEGETVIEKQNDFYQVFQSENKNDFDYMHSACFLSRSIKKLTHYYVEVNEVGIDLVKGKTYYFAVLAMVDGGESLVYIPLEVFVPDNSKYVYISVIIFVVLILVIIFIYKKYKRTKDRLTLENLIKDPNAKSNLTEIEMESAKKNKYGSLEEEIEQGKVEKKDSSSQEIGK